MQGGFPNRQRALPSTLFFVERRVTPSPGGGGGGVETRQRRDRGGWGVEVGVVRGGRCGEGEGAGAI